MTKRNKTPSLMHRLRQLTRSPYRRSKEAAAKFADYIGKSLRELHNRGKGFYNKTMKRLKLKGGRR